MRKSDKLKNFKKVNLITEQRYLESKGIVTESSIKEKMEMELMMSIKDKAENHGDASNEFYKLKTLNPELYDIAIKHYGDLVLPNVRKDSVVNDLDFKGLEESDFTPHNEYKKYEKIMYIGEPKTFYNGKTVKYGDIGEYIGTEGGEECWVAFPASGFATVFSNIKKVDEELDESIFSGVKDFGNRVLGITSKNQEAEKQKAIQEIERFDFRTLFIQTNILDLGVKTALAVRLKDAARYMPTVAKLDEVLFDTNGIDGEHAYMMSDKGERLEGFIPRKLFMIKGQHDLIDNEIARKKLEGYLNFM